MNTDPQPPELSEPPEPILPPIRKDIFGSPTYSVHSRNIVSKFSSQNCALILCILQKILPLTELSINGTVQYQLQFVEELAVIQKLVSLGIFKNLGEDKVSGIVTLDYIDISLINEMISQLEEKERGDGTITAEEFEAIKENYRKSTTHTRARPVDEEDDEDDEKTNEPPWQDDFHWEGKSFIFGEYGSTSSFKSETTYQLFCALTDAKGRWVSVRELCKITDKPDTFVRPTIGQMEKRLNKDLRAYISIPSTADDDFPPKPSEGAYRIKFTSNPL